jgi:hypothetical protein
MLRSIKAASIAPPFCPVRTDRVAETAIVVMAFTGAPLKRGKLSVEAPRGGALRWRYLNAYCAHLCRTWAPDLGSGLGAPHLARPTWGARLWQGFGHGPGHVTTAACSCNHFDHLARMPRERGTL